MAARRRLDVDLVRRGIAESRQQAQTLIAGGQVLVSGSIADKAARQVGADEPIELLGPPPRYVSRGGEKLAAALASFSLEFTGRRAVDAGASTGGFTDCLLQAGAASVVAIDVGRAQLHERLRSDPRVDSRERTDIRSVTAADIGGPVPIVVADLSFIALRSVVDALLGLLADDGDMVVLLKPQFEAGRREVSRGRGVIADAETWTRVLRDAHTVLIQRGADIMAAMPSPIRGAEGNVEFLLHVRKGSAGAPVDVMAVVASVEAV